MKRSRHSRIGNHHRMFATVTVGYFLATAVEFSSAFSSSSCSSCSSSKKIQQPNPSSAIFSVSDAADNNAFEDTSLFPLVGSSSSFTTSEEEEQDQQPNHHQQQQEEENNQASIMTDEEIVDDLSVQMKDYMISSNQQDLIVMEEEEEEEDQYIDRNDDQGKDVDTGGDPVLQQLEENLLATIQVLEDTLEETQIMNELEKIELQEQTALVKEDLEDHKTLLNQAYNQIQLERFLFDQFRYNPPPPIVTEEPQTQIQDQHHQQQQDQHQQQQETETVSMNPAMVSMFLQVQQEQHAHQIKELQVALEMEQKQRTLLEVEAEAQREAIAAAALVDATMKDEEIERENAIRRKNTKLLETTIQEQQELVRILNQKVGQLDKDLIDRTNELESQKELLVQQQAMATSKQEKLQQKVQSLEQKEKAAVTEDQKRQLSLEKLETDQLQLMEQLKKAQSESKQAKETSRLDKQELTSTKRTLAESLVKLSRMETEMARAQKQKQQNEENNKKKQQQLLMKEKAELEKKKKQQQLLLKQKAEQEMKKKQQQLLMKEKAEQEMKKKQQQLLLKEKAEQEKKKQRKKMQQSTYKSPSTIRPPKSAYQRTNRNASKETSVSQFPRLDNWEVTPNGEVQGKVYNHPSLPNGEPIRTSSLVNPRLAKSGAVVKTRSGSSYKLGRIAASSAPTVEKQVRLSTTKPGVPSFYNWQQAKEKNEPSNKAMGGLNIFRSNDDAKSEKTAKTPQTQAMTNINIFGNVNKKEEEVEKESDTTNPAIPKGLSPRLNFFGSSINSKKEEDKENETNQPKEEEKATPKVQPLSPMNFFGHSMKKSPEKDSEKNPAVEKKKPPVTTPAYGKAKTKVAIDTQEVQKAQELSLTGKSICNGKYLLAGKARMSVTGRCLITGAYLADQDSNPIGQPIVVKLSENTDAMRKEHSIYKKVLSGVSRGAIVKCMEYIPDVPDRPGKSALILERGIHDLKEHRRWHSFEGDSLKEALYSVNQCMESIHGARMVWTDLKTENFVVVEDEKTGDHSIKGIDLESAMKVRDHPIDYTPEATPPEFAKEFVSGDPHHFVLDYSFDVWSFGMLAYELATGVGYFDGNSPDTIMQKLSNHNVPNPNIGIEDDDLADLLAQCLALDPKHRPSAQKIARHKYFSSISKPGMFGLW